MTYDTSPADTVHGEHRWDYVFAGLYDRIMRRGEKRTMGRHRRELLTNARGRMLEVGAGTGANIIHYTDRVVELILAEPFAPMRLQIERKLRESGTPASTIDARRPKRSPWSGSQSTPSSRRWCCAPWISRILRWPRSHAFCAQPVSSCSSRCPLSLATRGPLAGSPAGPVATLRRWMSLQSRHDRLDQSCWLLDSA